MSWWFFWGRDLAFLFWGGELVAILHRENDSSVGQCWRCFGTDRCKHCGWPPRYRYVQVHCKKGLAVSSSAAGMSLTKLSLAGSYKIIPGKGEFLIRWLFAQRFVLSVFCIHCKENPIYVFIFWKLRGLSPNFHIHVSGRSDFYIPRIGLHNRQTDPGNI